MAQRIYQYSGEIFIIKVVLKLLFLKNVTVVYSKKIYWSYFILNLNVIYHFVNNEALLQHGDDIRLFKFQSFCNSHCNITLQISNKDNKAILT